MTVPCNVIRDLLPLCAEGLASEESKKLIEEHLESCPECRKRLEALKTPPAPAPDGAAALRGVKKAIRRRRLTAALLAALLVFLPLFALFARATDKVALPCEKALVRVESVEHGALTMSFSGHTSGMGSQILEDPDSGGKTLLLQAWSDRWNDRRTQTAGRNRLVFNGDFDRVVYGYGSEQTLLYGSPMDGGVQVLPRLALGFYLLLSLAATVASGLLWLTLRKKPAGKYLRVMFFAALSYPVGHLLIKGTQTLSFFLARDLAFILGASAAVWGLLMLGWAVLQRKKSEKA